MNLDIVGFRLQQLPNQVLCVILRGTVNNYPTKFCVLSYRNVLKFGMNLDIVGNYPTKLWAHPIETHLSCWVQSGCVFCGCSLPRVKA